MSPSKIISIILFLCLTILVWYVNSELYHAEAQSAAVVTFEVTEGDTASSLAKRLAEEQIIRSAFWFKVYVKLKDLDTKISHGTFKVEAPITLARVAGSLRDPSVQEREITIIPGWDLRDIAAYLVTEGIAENVAAVYAVSGLPADNSGFASPLDELDFRILNDKPPQVSFEGYLRPDTYRVFKSATIEDIFIKLIRARDEQFIQDWYDEIAQRGRTVHEVLTMASLLEREVLHEEDRAKVADLFWRRHDVNMGLQADSSVHYATGKKAEVFTTKAERDSKNPWNTYQYPKLPPGPISTPSKESIIAAIYPEPNDYWYFLTTLDTGEVKYARTLEEHNENVHKFIR